MSVIRSSYESEQQLTSRRRKEGSNSRDTAMRTRPQPHKACKSAHRSSYVWITAIAPGRVREGLKPAVALSAASVSGEGGLSFGIDLR